MICNHCSKDIASAEPYYLEEGSPSFGFPVGVQAGVIYLAPKYWIEKDGARIVFCSPHCSTAWHKEQFAKS